MSDKLELYNNIEKFCRRAFGDKYKNMHITHVDYYHDDYQEYRDDCFPKVGVWLFPEPIMVFEKLDKLYLENNSVSEAELIRCISQEYNARKDIKPLSVVITSKIYWDDTIEDVVEEFTSIKEVESAELDEFASCVGSFENYKYFLEFVLDRDLSNNDLPPDYKEAVDFVLYLTLKNEKVREVILRYFGLHDFTKQKTSYIAEALGVSITYVGMLRRTGLELIRRNPTHETILLHGLKAYSEGIGEYHTMHELAELFMKQDIREFAMLNEHCFQVIYNYLKREGYNLTVYSLFAMTDEEISGIHGIGGVKLGYIKGFMAEYWSRYSDLGFNDFRNYLWGYVRDDIKYKEFISAVLEMDISDVELPPDYVGSIQYAINLASTGFGLRTSNILHCYFGIGRNKRSTLEEIVQDNSMLSEGYAKQVIDNAVNTMGHSAITPLIEKILIDGKEAYKQELESGKFRYSLKECVEVLKHLSIYGIEDDLDAYCCNILRRYFYNRKNVCLYDIFMLTDEELHGIKRVGDKIRERIKLGLDKSLRKYIDMSLEEFQASQVGID